MDIKIKDPFTGKMVQVKKAEQPVLYDAIVTALARKTNTDAICFEAISSMRSFDLTAKVGGGL